MSDYAHDEAELQVLVGRVRSGDAFAEAELAERLRPRLVMMMRMRTRRTDIVEDLAQDAWMALSQALRAERTTEIRSIGAFVYGIARNVANSEFRRDKRRPQTIADLPLESLNVSRPVDFASLAQARLVRAALAALPDSDRALLAGAFEEGLDAPELATRLGVASATVRQRKSRLLKKIAEIIQAPSQKKDT